MQEVISKYLSRGILLDSNIYLLYLVGQYDPDRIERFKRTRTFIKKDFLLLKKFVARFPKVVTTPHILTEVSNLASNLEESLKEACFKVFATELSYLDERFLSAMEITSSEAFPRYGITDSAISIVAKQEFLVLTDDLKLSVELFRNGVDVINFNHIRPLGWEL